MTSPTQLLELSVEIARRAGDLLVERWQGPARGVSSKGSPTDLVSDADRDSEKLILDLLSNARPDDGIVGEEGAARRGTTGLEWVVDPLDGTVNYLYGIPHWSVSIAVTSGGNVVAGVVHDPRRDETFAASSGDGATLNGRPITVGACRDLSQALIGTGFAYDQTVRAVQAETVARVLPNVRDVRRSGSAALDLAWLACGRYDGFYEAHMKPWDRAAGELIVREAGGRVVPLADPGRDSDGVVAAGPGIFDSLRRLVGG